MPQLSPIEWTDYTSNPIRAINLATGKRGHFCVHASDGCARCYSERLNRWRGNGLAFIAQNRDKVRFELDLAELKAWRRLKPGQKLFAFDMTDLFQDDIPDEMIDQVIAAVALTPATVQILTKRAKRMREYFAHPRPQVSYWLGRMVADDGVSEIARVSELQARIQVRELWPLPNLWLGVSAEDQKNADRRIPELLATPAAVRFVSYEPALGPVDFTKINLRPLENDREAWTDALSGAAFTCDSHAEADVDCIRLDWIICGGESGPNARPMHSDWARSVRDRCQAAGVAYFFKQWGEWYPTLANAGDPGGKVLRGFTFEDGQHMWLLGKKHSGRTLDGRTWDEFPALTSQPERTPTP